MADLDPSPEAKTPEPILTNWHSWLRPGAHPTWQLWWG